MRALTPHLGQFVYTKCDSLAICFFFFLILIQFFFIFKHFNDLTLERCYDLQNRFSYERKSMKQIIAIIFFCLLIRIVNALKRDPSKTKCQQNFVWFSTVDKQYGKYTHEMRIFRAARTFVFPILQY